MDSHRIIGTAGAPGGKDRTPLLQALQRRAPPEAQSMSTCCTHRLVRSVAFCPWSALALRPVVQASFRRPGTSSEPPGSESPIREQISTAADQRSAATSEICPATEVVSVARDIISKETQEIAAGAEKI